MVKAAIKIQAGFLQDAAPLYSVGVSRLHSKLAEIYYDRRDYWLGIRKWNDDPLGIVASLMDRNPASIIDISYSWGCGEGVLGFAQNLAKINRKVDLLILIDPVTRKFPYFNALWFNDSFVVPKNVSNVMLFRTVNQKNMWMPWGRDIELEDPETQIINKFVFGTPDNLRKYNQDNKDKYTEIPEVAPQTFHTNIDDSELVHKEIIKVVKKFI